MVVDGEGCCRVGGGGVVEAQVAWVSSVQFSVGLSMLEEVSFWILNQIEES